MKLANSNLNSVGTDDRARAQGRARRQAERLLDELVALTRQGRIGEALPAAEQSAGLIRDIRPAGGIVRRIADEGALSPQESRTGLALTLLTARQQPIHRFSTAGQRLARRAVAADIAHFSFRDDVDETQKNVRRQVRPVLPTRELRFRRPQVQPKLFITANNFRCAPERALVNILKHRTPFNLDVQTCFD